MKDCLYVRYLILDVITLMTVTFCASVHAVDMINDISIHSAQDVNVQDGSKLSQAILDDIRGYNAAECVKIGIIDENICVSFIIIAM